MCEKMMALKESPGDVIVLPGQLLPVVLSLQSNWAAHNVRWEMETIHHDSRLKHFWLLESQASKSNNEIDTFKTTKHFLQESIPFVFVRFRIWSTV